MPPTPAATQQQLDAIIEFMQEHRDLARGLLRGTDGRIRAKRLWEGLCISLNSMGGCSKSVEQWQRVWANKKHAAKKNAAAAKRSMCGTGGGPSSSLSLSQLEIKIVSIMGEGFGEPQTEARVAAFPMHVKSGSNSVAQPVQPSPPNVVATLNTKLGGQHTNQHNHKRKLQSVQRHQRVGVDDSIRSRLFQLEERRLRVDEERNRELRELKIVLTEQFQAIRVLLGDLSQNLNPITKR